MDDKLGQEPAYPNPFEMWKETGEIIGGMSKRFYAACAAMQGFISMGCVNPNGLNNPNYDNIIGESYKFADQLLKQE